MSKKKKKKTKEQKKKAIINRQKYLSVMKKPETALKERKVAITKESPKAIQEVKDDKDVGENKFTISNIKRSIGYALIFIIIIFGLYYAELKIGYFSSVSNSLISILTK